MDRRLPAVFKNEDGTAALKVQAKPGKATTSTGRDHVRTVAGGTHHVGRRSTKAVKPFAE